MNKNYALNFFIKNVLSSTQLLCIIIFNNKFGKVFIMLLVFLTLAEIAYSDLSSFQCASSSKYGNLF